jgi:hypothetical protein
MGESVSFTARIVDSEGIEMPDFKDISWEVDHPEYGEVDASGCFRPTMPGKCKVMSVCKNLGIGWCANVEILK